MYAYGNKVVKHDGEVGNRGDAGERLFISSLALFLFIYLIVQQTP
jgi:hypothetical protein